MMATTTSRPLLASMVASAPCISVLRRRLATTMHPSIPRSSPSVVVPSSFLQDSIPRLRQAFDKEVKKRGDGRLFPILSEKEEEESFRQYPPPDNRQAAVLVPLVDDNNKGMPALLFTKRAANMSSHASEISFPGGHMDPTEGDKSLEDTALRETYEEIGVPPDLVTVLGCGSAIPSIRGTPVTPVLAVIPYEFHSLSTDRHHTEEVDEVFCVTLADLYEQETTHILSRLGTPAPLYPTDHGNVWGLTAFILHPILHNLYKPVFDLKRRRKA